MCMSASMSDLVLVPLQKDVKQEVFGEGTRKRIQVPDSGEVIVIGRSREGQGINHPMVSRCVGARGAFHTLSSFGALMRRYVLSSVGLMRDAAVAWMLQCHENVLITGALVVLACT